MSKMLEVTADNITLKSEDAENPVPIRREEEFAGKSYARDAGNVLVGISSGSLATQDIILDGGAVLDKDFNNTGQVWDSPLVYVKGSYAMRAGTVLQNNYNTDYSESADSSRSVRTAGAVDVAWDASMTMDGGLIQDCYTLGHSSISITLNIYIHVLDKKMEEELQKFGSAKTQEREAYAGLDVKKVQITALSHC